MPQDPRMQGLASTMPQENLDALRDYYHRARQLPFEHLEPGLPDVAPPSWFQPDPLVVGQPSFARTAKTLLDLDPGTKARTGIITQGPNGSSMREMIHSKLPVHSFAGTSLAGITNKRTGEVGINPRMSDSDTLTTLVHELAHVADYNELGALRAEELAGTMSPADRADPTTAALLKGLKAAEKR